MNKPIIAALIACTTSLPTASWAGPVLIGDLTAQDVNALVALEATQNDLLMVGLAIDEQIGPQHLGTWTGLINEAGWSLTFSGSVNNHPLSITQLGTLDLIAERATWVDTGFLGSTPLNGSGFIEFDPRWGQVFFGIAAAGVQVLSASTVVGAVGGALVSGLVIAGEDALDEAAEELEAEIKRREQSTKLRSKSSLNESTFRPDPLLQVRFIQGGTLDVISGQTVIDSKVAPIPAPGAFLLLATGLIGLLAYGRAPLRKSADGRGPPFPGRPYSTASVIGMQSAV